MDSRADWFQQRELGEALMLRLLLIDGKVDEARGVFSRALQMADPTDIYAAAWLTAECGKDLLPFAPEIVEDAAHGYGSRPEVLGNPKIKDRFTVLLFDSKSTIDRS